MTDAALWRYGVQMACHTTEEVDQTNGVEREVAGMEKNCTHTYRIGMILVD